MTRETKEKKPATKTMTGETKQVTKEGKDERPTTTPSSAPLPQDSIPQPRGPNPHPDIFDPPQPHPVRDPDSPYFGGEIPQPPGPFPVAPNPLGPLGPSRPFGEPAQPRLPDPLAGPPRARIPGPFPPQPPSKPGHRKGPNQPTYF